MLWAENNIGADNVSDYGTYYSLSQVSASGNAFNGWSGSRLPTKGEIEELVTNCNWKGETVNGTYGFTLTSKQEGYTDRSIFFPAAGADDYSVGEWGLYWSSTKYDDGDYYILLLNGNSATASYFMDSFEMPVRPVADKQN